MHSKQTNSVLSTPSNDTNNINLKTLQLPTLRLIYEPVVAVGEGVGGGGGEWGGRE